MNNEIYKIALSLIPGIGGVLARNLVSYVGSIEGVFSESKTNLLKIPGIGEVNARRIKDPEILKRAENEVLFTQKYHIDVHFYTDKTYPRRLSVCSDAPILLFSKGTMDLNKEKMISIVGTRNATNYGKNIVEELVEALAARKYNITIVSGLAYGIDIHAHKMALKNNIETIGVVAHGLDQLYPSLHKETAKKMLENGGLVSDFASQTKIDPSNFLKRNRIIAGLSDATIVVESAIKGGALVTADIASSYNRDVFAFPGRANDTYSRGCNHLIKKNVASLIEDINDLEYVLNWVKPENKKVVQSKLFIDLNSEEEKVLKLFDGKKDLFIDQISALAEMPVSKVSALLLSLEFKNIIDSLPGKMYRLK